MRLKRKPTYSGDTKPTATETVIDVIRDGDWLPPEEFRAIALSAAQAEGDLTVNLQGTDHLDASALQILLALAAEEARQRTVSRECFPNLIPLVRVRGRTGTQLCGTRGVNGHA
jgi:hypothetical protein